MCGIALNLARRRLREDLVACGLAPAGFGAGTGPEEQAEAAEMAELVNRAWRLASVRRSCCSTGRA